MRKMEHILWSRWSRGNDAMGRSAELRIQRRELCGLPKSSSRTSKTDPEAVLSLWVILRRTKMISIPFCSSKMRKMEQI